MIRLFRGTVRPGYNNASHWLTLFADAYEAKLGRRFFPGTLNLELELPCDWHSNDLTGGLIRFGRDEMGGERDVLLYPARLPELGGTAGFLWTTTIGAQERPDPRVVEFISSVGLRDRFGLEDGDVVLLELGTGSPDPAVQRTGAGEGAGFIVDGLDDYILIGGDRYIRDHDEGFIWIGVFLVTLGVLIVLKGSRAYLRDQS